LIRSSFQDGPSGLATAAYNTSGDHEAPVSSASARRPWLFTRRTTRMQSPHCISPHCGESSQSLGLLMSRCPLVAHLGNQFGVGATHPDQFCSSGDAHSGIQARKVIFCHPSQPKPLR
jgi:hypothetical protein